MSETDVTVKLVDENELPPGHAWALVRQQKTESQPPRSLLFVKRDAVPMSLLDAVAALSQLERRSP